MSTTLALFFAILTSSPAFSADTPAATVAAPMSAADSALALRLLQRGDDLYRGTSSTAQMTMEVVTAHYQRTMTMSVSSQGTDKTLVRILKPAKDAGVATLKVGENLWNYLPNVDRTMKIPSGMMSGAWMGSHLSNDDLVRASRFSNDYTWQITARPTGDQGQWTIRCVPKPDAPVVWGHVEVDIGPDEIMRQMRYFDEHGVLVRTITMSDVAEMDGRKIPRLMVVQPADKPSERTSVHYESIDFDVTLPESTFSLAALRP